ncbi:MAG: anti-sigma factor family protein [Geminicoccaceae bacterium]
MGRLRFRAKNYAKKNGAVSAGLTFVGGRVFFVNGMPTGLIAYHDREGKLTGFRFTPNSDGQESAPTLSQDNDLNLVSWQKNGIDYVLVGWADPAELGLVGTQLQRNYGDEI